MVFQRVMNCIMYLASHNIALRDHVDILDAAEETNAGNVLSPLKLVTKYDPV